MLPPPSPVSPTLKETLTSLNALTQIHRLTLQAFSTQDKMSLIFLILNDTISAIRYDRAVLWDIDKLKPKLLGVSGQASISANSELAQKWKRLVEEIKTHSLPEILSIEKFPHEHYLWKDYTSTPFPSSVVWIPFVIDGKPRLGLWLERWEKSVWSPQELEPLQLLAEAYALACKRFQPRFNNQLRKNLAWLMACTLLALLFLIRLPMRIIAPCEVLPKDPFVISAPLDDIVGHISVKPGQQVTPGTPLVKYDGREAFRTLKIAQEEYKVAEEELRRAKILAFKDEESLNEIAILESQFKREEANLALARYRVSQLVIKSPVAGTAMFENPDEWRGKPVKIGDKILMIINPNQTKIRVWIPEKEMIPLNLARPIKIFLNNTPTVNRLAKLIFISEASTLSDKKVVSFMAEADWMEEEKTITPGLKGSSLLYGEKVSLFYWLIHKPWISFRDWIGL